MIVENCSQKELTVDDYTLNDRAIWSQSPRNVVLSAFDNLYSPMKGRGKSNHI